MMSNVHKGWLEEQLQYAKNKAEDWPEWKKEPLYNSSREKSDKNAAIHEKQVEPIANSHI